MRAGVTTGVTPELFAGVLAGWQPDDPLHPLRGFRASIIPVLLHPERLRLPADHHYRPPEATPEELDPTIAEPATGCPFVPASLGSKAVHLYGEGPSPMDASIETLGDLPVAALVGLFST